MTATKRLQHWREQREAIEGTMMKDLAFASLARPILLEDLAQVDRFIAYYEGVIANALLKRDMKPA